MIRRIDFFRARSSTWLIALFLSHITLGVNSLPAKAECVTSFDHDTPPSLRYVRKHFTIEERIERLEELLPGQRQALLRLQNDITKIAELEHFYDIDIQKTLYGFMYELRSLENWVERQADVEVLPFRHGKHHHPHRITDFVVNDKYIELKARAIEDLTQGDLIFERTYTHNGVKITLVPAKVKNFSKSALESRLENLERKVTKRVRKANSATRYSVKKIEGDHAVNDFDRIAAIHLDFRHISDSHARTVTDWAKNLDETFKRMSSVSLDYIVIEISLHNKQLIFFYPKEKLDPKDKNYMEVKRLFSQAI